MIRLKDRTDAATIGATPPRSPCCVPSQSRSGLPARPSKLRPPETGEVRIVPQYPLPRRRTRSRRPPPHRIREMTDHPPGGGIRLPRKGIPPASCKECAENRNKLRGLLFYSSGVGMSPPDRGPESRMRSPFDLCHGLRGPAGTPSSFHPSPVRVRPGQSRCPTVRGCTRRGSRGEKGDWLEAKRRACPPSRRERGQAPAPCRLRSQSPFPRFDPPRTHSEARK
jgi:hypothetical protein